MKNILVLLIILPQMIYTQHNWVKNRDWIIGEYEGYQVDSTSRPNIKVPFNFQIKYLSDRFPEMDTIVSIYPNDHWFKVRNDSILVLDCCSDFWLNYWGKFYSDSTIEFLYIEPFIFTGGHRIYNWGKMIKSYVATENYENSDIKIWPNPVKDVLNISYTDKVKYISIINCQGIKVLSNYLVTNQTIDISFLPTGFYWIQIFSDRKYTSSRFVKIE